MQYIQSMLLGLVQGLTEFLPVSSSGHLAIFKRILGADALATSLTFDILLHIGTLVAVFLVYRRDIWMLIREFFGMVWDLLRGKPNFKKPYRRFVLMVIIGSIPAGLAGILLKDMIAELSLLYVGIFLFVTAALLFFSDKMREGTLDMKNAPLSSALCVGLFQAVAILPGISRSGSTIAGGRTMGFRKEFAVEFSFILSIPAILGAALIDFKDVLGGEAALQLDLLPAILGMAVAAVSGFLAIRFLLRLLQNKKFYIFSYYCIAAGIGALLLYFLG